MDCFWQPLSSKVFLVALACIWYTRYVCHIISFSNLIHNSWINICHVALSSCSNIKQVAWMIHSFARFAWLVMLLFIYSMKLMMISVGHKLGSDQWINSWGNFRDGMHLGSSFSLQDLPSWPPSTKARE